MKKWLSLRLVSVGVIFILLVTIVLVVTNIDPAKTTKSLQKEYTNVTPTQWVTFKINDYSINIDTYSNNAVYDTGWLTSEQLTTISAGEFCGYDITINDIPIKSNNSITIKLNKLDSSNFIKIKVKEIRTDFERTINIRTLPAAFPKFTSVGQSNDKGFYYFTSGNYIIKMDTDGNVVYYRSATKPYDFKRQETNGKVRYTYLESIPNTIPITKVEMSYCKAVVLDEKYSVINIISNMEKTADVSANQLLDNHEFALIDDNNYILSTYLTKRVKNIPGNVARSQLGTRVVASVLQEIKDGKVVWQWDSTEHPELYSLSTNPNDYYNQKTDWADYAHFDSLTVDPKDGNFICSFSHLDSIIKIDRNTGKIIWILGGKGDQFKLSDEQKFYNQHSVGITEDGSITLFNNGVKNQSNILEFKLYEAQKNILKYQKFQVEKIYSSDSGSAQKLKNSTFVISWGNHAESGVLFSEIDFQNNDVKFELINSTSNAEYSLPRVYKFAK